MAKIDRITGKDWAEKLKKGLRGALDEVEKGIRAVKEAPGAKASSRATFWQEKVSSREALERFKTNVNIPLSDWQKITIEKGLKNIPTGLEASSEKLEKRGNALIEAIKEVRAKLPPEKPKTLEEALKNVETFLRGMAEKKGKIR